MLQPGQFIWMNGHMVPWEDAKVHVLAHALHYGSSVFEGIRTYATRQGPAIFCLPQHVDRLFDSCKIHRMELPYTPAQITDVIVNTVRQNGHSSCYIRPLIFRGMGSFHLDPRKSPVEVAIATLDYGRYLGTAAIEQGVDVMVSSWRRMAPDTSVAMAKIGGQYVNSQFIAMEAIDYGFVEGLALDATGFISEGSGENVFIVKDGTVYTPTLANSVLSGVTRKVVITLCHDLGIPVQETVLPREFLYIADEAFFTGTAAEITPIRSVDRLPVGNGRGPLTARLQEEFFGITEGRIPDRNGWLTFVGTAKRATASTGTP